MTHRYLFVIACLLMLPIVAPLRADDLPPTLKGAPLVFIATLKEVEEGPVARSFPPIYTFRLTFEKADKPLRGTLPEKLGPFHFNHRGEAPPPMKIGERYLVAAKSSQGAAIVALVPATDDIVDQAKSALSLPLGWAKEGGAIVSPWASRGADWWPADAKLSADLMREIGPPRFALWRWYFSSRRASAAEEFAGVQKPIRRREVQSHCHQHRQNGADGGGTDQRR